MEIIRMVEESELPVKRTLPELDVPRSTFYGWFRKYETESFDGLADRSIGPNRFWNRIPAMERKRAVANRFHLFQNNRPGLVLFRLPSG
jgi:putative transposase